MSGSGGWPAVRGARGSRGGRAITVTPARPNCPGLGGHDGSGRRVIVERRSEIRQRKQSQRR